MPDFLPQRSSWKTSWAEWIVNLPSGKVIHSHPFELRRPTDSQTDRGAAHSNAYSKDQCLDMGSNIHCHIRPNAFLFLRLPSDSLKLVELKPNT